MRKRNGLKDSNIPIRLIIIRDKKGLSRKEVAEYLGVTVQNVSFMENGTIGVTLENAIKLSELYNMTLDEMFAKPMQVMV